MSVLLAYMPNFKHPTHPLALVLDSSLSSDVID
jgi:hypothetical protein